MKKYLSVLLILFFCAGLLGCGKTTNPNINEPQSMIKLSVKDGNHNINQFSVYVAVLDNVTDKYLSGIVVVNAFDQNKNRVGKETLFLNNLAPHDDIGQSILVPFLDGVDFDYEIVRLTSSEKATKTPEITNENLYEYVYLTCNDYNDIYNNRKSITANLNNLTTQYMSAKVVVTVKDQNRSVLTKEMEEIQNMGPYSSKAIVLLFDITDSYIIEYTIENYLFTDSPSAMQ